MALRIALAALAVAVIAAVFLAHAPATRRPAPPLPSGVRQGPAVTLAQLRGHPAALVFWATWCDNCHAEAAAVERFARSRIGAGHVVGIDYSDGGNWRGFLRAYHWSFPVLADPDGTTLEAYRATVGVPATVILDPGGRIASIDYGTQTYRSLTQAFAAAA
jgi:thiol-disulfide isomerase/thioredoxin